MPIAQYLHIPGNEETLDIVMDPEKGKVTFKGVSLPEDVSSFFMPVFDWINDYLESPQEKTRIHFNMQYFNTASSKYFLDILENIAELKRKKKDVIVEWVYDEDDEDMEEAGYTLEHLTKLHFIFTPL